MSVPGMCATTNVDKTDTMVVIVNMEPNAHVIKILARAVFSI